MPPRMIKSVLELIDLVVVFLFSDVPSDNFEPVLIVTGASFVMIFISLISGYYRAVVLET